MYDINYFIQKFEAIPEEKWTTGQFENKLGGHCALGHCGVKIIQGVDSDLDSIDSLINKYPEAKALNTLTAPFREGYNIWNINDHSGTFRGDHPKTRILALLYFTKLQMQEQESQNAVNEVNLIIATAKTPELV